MAGLAVGGAVVALLWWELLRHWALRLRPTRRRALSLRQMQALSPAEFEAYVGQRLFARQGYAVVNTPDTRDGGIDLLITDRNGEQAVVQCKRYRGTVGEETIRDLYGTMMHAGASYGFLVTTGSISQAARTWATGKPLTLIDGATLEQLARTQAPEGALWYRAARRRSLRIAGRDSTRPRTRSLPSPARLNWASTVSSSTFI
jgi:restriction system protein